MPYRWRRQILSYNGTGTFVINSAGTPYVSGTVISSTAANALNSDLATGLTTAITKDGQTTPTANIPLGGFRITNLGAGTVATDAARLSQVQNSTTTTLIAITGTDTLTGTVSPTLTAYATGQVFSFVVAATNTGAVTLNVDSIGVKAVTRTGAVALVAGDMVTGQIAIVEYDGTRFQLINGNSFTNLKVSGTLGVTGATTLSSTLGVTGVTTIAAGTALLPALTTTGDTNTGVWFPAADTIAASTGGSERIRIASGGNVGIACTPARRLSVQYDFAKTDTSSRAIAVFKSNDASNANEMLISSTGAASQASRVWDIQTGEDGVSNSGFLALQSSGGNVGIGTTSSIQSGSFSVSTGNCAGGFKTSASAASGLLLDLSRTSATGDMIYFKTGSTTLAGTISCPTSNTTTYNSVSDYRLKENVTPMTGALAKVAALRPVTFTWISDGIAGQGFIAHELQAVVPDSVSGEKDAIRLVDELDADGKKIGTKEEPRYQGVDTSVLVATLTSAIQELKAIIDTQAARITALETA